MRRITGTYAEVEYTVVEYADGLVECPADLRALLEADQLEMPTGAVLLEQCREIFGDTLRVQEYR